MVGNTISDMKYHSYQIWSEVLQYRELCSSRVSDMLKFHSIIHELAQYRFKQTRTKGQDYQERREIPFVLSLPVW